MKEWFNSLEKREQIALLGCAVVVALLLVWSSFTDLQNEKAQYLKRNASADQTLAWMNQAVAQIKAAQGGGQSSSADISGKSLSQLSELAAKRSKIRFSRFQPKGEHEAQVWFDKIEFAKLLDFLARLELDYAVQVETMSVNSANTPGLVNARIKFTK